MTSGPKGRTRPVPDAGATTPRTSTSRRSMLTVNAYAATVRDGTPRSDHHRAPGRRPARRPDRHQVRRHLPLGHPHRPRRLGPAAVPAGARPRDRRHRHRSRLGRHQARRRRPRRRRLHGQLVPRVRQLPEGRGAVLPAREHRHLRRRGPRRHHHPGRLLHPRRRDRGLRRADPGGHRARRRRAAAVRRHHHVLPAAPLGRRPRQEGRRRRPRRARPHGRQARPRAWAPRSPSCRSR